MHILLIEDEKDLVIFLRKILENAGNKVASFHSLEEFTQSGYEHNYDLALLDLMLPGKSGRELVKDLRKENIHIPILVLSAMDQAPTKTELLNLGADDYLAKPFNTEELLARVNALYRRSMDSSYGDEIAYQDLRFFRKQNKAVRGAKEILLTEKEGDLLQFLMQNQEKVIRTSDILRRVWEAKSGYHSNIVQATIRRLRQKVDRGFDHKLIHNVHGIGYRLSGD